jgi:nitrogen regulatory protein PII
MRGFPADFSVKKIEAIIDPAALDAVKLHLAQAGIDGRLTVTEVSGLENLGRFYQHEPTAENPWKPCLRIDLIVSDRQTESAVNVILRQANLAGEPGASGHNSKFDLDQCIFEAGSDAEHFYLIHNGNVALETFTPGKGRYTNPTLTQLILAWPGRFSPTIAPRNGECPPRLTWRNPQL